MTFHEPLGVVGVIVPWNFPMPIAGWGFAPALAAGNTVVLKPAELTPLTAMRLGRAGAGGRPARGRVHRAAGQGLGGGERFVTHPAVRKICFTGSTEVGKRIMAGCAEQVKRLTLELGGKSANIVFADADLERAAATRRPRSSTTPARTAAPGPGSWSSARCTTGSWSCSSRPSARFRVQDPALETAEMGPLISAGQRDGVRPMWTTPTSRSPARARPGRVLVPADGAARRTGPATGTGARRSSAGRLGAAVRRRGRGAPAGQRHRVRAVRLDLDPRPRPGDAGRPGRRVGQPQRQLALVGAVLDPFGGMKQSGLGRELGPDALAAFTDVKNVFISTE